MWRSLMVVAMWCASTVVQAADQPAQLDPSAKLEAVLYTRTEVMYRDTKLEDVAADLAIRHGISVTIDREAVEAATGKKLPEVLLSLTLRDVPLGSLLNHLFRSTGLTWAIRDGDLVITSVEKEPQYVITKVYQVEFDDLGSLQGVIELTIDTDSWQSFGGTVGTITPNQDTLSLTITHTAQTQRRIGYLLHDLRAALADTTK